MVSPFSERISQIRFLANLAKDVAQATSLAILVKAYTSGASPSPYGGWHVTSALELAPVH